MTEQELKAKAAEFVAIKSEADKFKKQAEDLNNNLKRAMELLNADEVQLDDGARVVYSVTKKETLNEERLLKILKEVAPETNCIKTKEYVDMDILESEVYRGQLSADAMLALDQCRVVKEIPTLTIRKAKKGK